MRRLLRPGPSAGLRTTSIAMLLLLGAGPTSSGQEPTAADDPSATPRPGPKLARDYLDTGDAWRAKGEFDRAIDSYDEAIRLDPRNAYAYAARGAARRDRHDLREAIADYSTAIALEPGNPSYWLGRGEVWSRQGSHVRAMADLDEGVRLNPDGATGYCYRAAEWEKDLKPDRALADYQAAIARDPVAVLAYLGRGRIWRKSGEYAKVVANFDELSRAAPDEPIGHREVAWLLATCDQDAIRDGRRALQEATRACELTAWKDPDCLEAMAAACAEVGDFDAAVKWQSRALEIFNGSRDRFDRRLVANRRKDAQMSHRLYMYGKRLPYHERPDRAVR